jgi:hypothetical protein
MPNIIDYTETIKVVLVETAKYFALLLFSVLAIRLWRRWSKMPGRTRLKNFALAGLATCLAGAIGFFSLCHSLGVMYSYFGMKAFRDYRIDPALSLFQTSLTYWKSPAAIGRKGVCLLWTGKADEGIRLLDEARRLRKGQGTPFEDYYEGLYFFSQDNVTNAAPLLEAASADIDYNWSIIKIFAAIQLDRHQPQEALKLMQPFLKVEVTEADQAYVMAGLKLTEGKNAEAQALVDKFSTGDLTPFWKVRFDRLRERMHPPNP